jgi:hypothetical protein
VSPTGALTVVECKLHYSPDMKRKIVGQLFAYAAGLWEMSYGEFDEAWQAKSQPFTMTVDQWERRKRPPLLEDMETAVVEHGLSWDRNTFPAAVEANLTAGRYTLVFAVDEITDELKRVVQYLSEHSAPAVNVIALEIGYLTDGDIEVLVPQPYGQELAERKPPLTGDPLAPDDPSFMAALAAAKGGWALPLAADLLVWARTSGLAVWYGKGDTIGTVNAGLLDASGKRRGFVNWSTSGQVAVIHNLLKHFVPFDSRDSRVELLARLTAVDGVSRPETQADSWSTVDLERLRNPEALAAFTVLLDDVVNRIRNATVPSS